MSMITANAETSLTYNRPRDHYQLIRHATLFVQLNGVKFLVDPMLSGKGAMDPVTNAGNEIRIPMVELPLAQNELSNMLASVDAVLLTHLHRDHWDEQARSFIGKQTPVFCQPGDESQIRSAGFQNVKTVTNTLNYKGISISLTGGHHGTGEIGKKMGKVSGFILGSEKKKVYIAGDTIFCNEVREAIESFKPEHIIVNAGSAQFLTGDPITMGIADLASVCAILPEHSKLSAVHMDTVNHCLLTRTKLRATIADGKLPKIIQIPEDGEIIFL